MMRAHVAFLLTFVSLGGCKDKDGRTHADPTMQQSARPDAVAKRYLELGAAGDLSKIRELVDPKCHAGKEGSADAVKMLGVRMTVKEATTAIEKEEGDSATVKYTLAGSVDGKNARSETDIFGKPVEVKVQGLSMAGVTQSGVLSLKKLDGRWVVTC